MVWKKNIVVFIRKFALDISKARNYLLSVNNIADSNDSMSSLDENIQDSIVRVSPYCTVRVLYCTVRVSPCMRGAFADVVGVGVAGEQWNISGTSIKL